MSRPAAGFFAGTYLADCIAGDPARCRALLAEKAGVGESSEKLLARAHGWEPMGTSQPTDRQQDYPGG